MNINLVYIGDLFCFECDNLIIFVFDDLIGEALYNEFLTSRFISDVGKNHLDQMIPNFV